MQGGSDERKEEAIVIWDTEQGKVHGRWIWQEDSCV